MNKYPRRHVSPHELAAAHWTTQKKSTSRTTQSKLDQKIYFSAIQHAHTKHNIKKGHKFFFFFFSFLIRRREKRLKNNSFDKGSNSRNIHIAAKGKKLKCVPANLFYFYYWQYCSRDIDKEMLRKRKFQTAPARLWMISSEGNCTVLFRRRHVIRWGDSQ